jgi:hypothetical protein
MKRKEFPHSRMVFPPFVRHIAHRQPNSTPAFSMIRQPGIRARKIFVIKQAGWLRSANSVDKKICRILIFDDHPESLRLVSGCRENANGDLSEAASITSWEVILASILATVALIGMLWPLF